MSIDLRLQLLEPSKYPQLLKCLYGIFMLLPQSASLSPLRSRLNSASSLGFMHAMPKKYVFIHVHDGCSRANRDSLQ